VKTAKNAEIVKNVKNAENAEIVKNSNNVKNGNSILVGALLEALNKRESCAIVLTKKLSYKEGALEFEARVEANNESRIAGFFDSPEEAIREIENAANALRKQEKGVVEIAPDLLQELRKLRANARLNAAFVKTL